MLLDCFEKLKNVKFVKLLRSFFDSWAYLVFIVAGMVLANLFSLELYVFYFYLAIGFLIVLFADDLRYVAPIVPCCYMSISAANNPAAGAAQGAGVFYQPAFLLQLIFLLATGVTILVVRLISLRLYGEKKKVPKLLIGFGALGLSYILGGLFSPYYEFRTAFFGFVEILSLCAFYFFFYYGVDFKTLKKEYWAKVFTAVGLGILVEVLYIYFTKDVFANGNRGLIVTGWGIYNNIGCAMAMCLPAPLYLATIKKNGWIYFLCSVVLAAGLALTQSRGSILFGFIVYAIGVVLMFVASPKKERLGQAIVLGCLVAVAVLSVAVPAVRGKILDIYKSMSQHNFFEPSGRLEIYRAGMKQFKENPFFGVGFYQCGAFRWGTYSPEAFFPGRYHNTYVQLLASGGIFAAVCYLLHRVETLFLFFRRPSREKTFLSLIVAALLATAIVDCHFFNIGPGLLYGIVLAFAEGAAERDAAAPLPEQAAPEAQPAEETSAEKEPAETAPAE